MYYIDEKKSLNHYKQILNVYNEGEFMEEGTKRKIGIPVFSIKLKIYYNQDVIISVGYRVKPMLKLKAKLL